MAVGAGVGVTSVVGVGVSVAGVVDVGVGIAGIVDVGVAGSSTCAPSHPASIDTASVYPANCRSSLLLFITIYLTLS